MYKDLLEIIETYKTVIIPALESGQIEMNEYVIDTFLQFVSTIYNNTDYSNPEKDTEFKNKLYQYYSKGDTKSIIGIFYSFIMASGAILSLQYLVKNNSYIIQSKMGHMANCQKNYYWKKSHVYPTHDSFTGKGVIYSAITGNYDTVHDPLVLNPKYDYILFTNNPNIKSNIWKIVYLDNPEKLDNIRLARHVKIKGFEYLSGYDYSIWVDGKLQITGNIDDYINQNKGDMPILCMPHYINNCIFEEKEVCESLNKDNSEIMTKQIKEYSYEGYPKNFGMIDSCVLVRELHNEKLNSVMNTWWNEVNNKSYRDQLSFNYSFWKEDYIYDTANIFCYNNPYFRLFDHQ